MFPFQLSPQPIPLFVYPCRQAYHADVAVATQSSS